MKTEFGKKLLSIRNSYIKEGGKLLTAKEISEYRYNDYKPLSAFGKRPKTIMKRFLEQFFTILAIIALGFFFTIILLEWLAGCGESYVDYMGVRHVNECLFIK